MRLRDGVKEVGRVIVHCKNAVRPRIQILKRAKRQGLVDVIAPVGVKVDLLQDADVRVFIRNRPANRLDVCGQSLLGPRARLGAAVHEEAEIVFICAEADVPAEHLIFRIRLGRLHAAASLRHAERLIVLDARIRPEHIAHIQKHDGQHRQQRDCRNFQDLFQASSLLMVLLKRIIPQFPQKCNPREKNKFSILRIILKIILAFFRSLWYAKGRRNRPSAGGSLFIRRIFYVLRQKNDR